MKQPIAFLGDVHGALTVLHAAAERAARDGCCALVQVGDCGWTPKWQLPAFAVPVLWIDGNHEHWPAVQNLLDAPMPVRLSNTFTYVPRGCALTLGGWRLGFLGGASSVDAQWQRALGVWNACETVVPAQALWLTEPVDLLVTHTPPQSTIDAHFDPRDLERFFGLDPSWRDPSAAIVEATQKRLGNPPLVCGHMHRAVTHENVRILTCDEYAVWNGGWV